MAAAEGSSPTTTASRPDWLPEAHWDTATNSIKPEFGAHFKELSDLKTAQDARAAARPEKPDGYALELPKTFKTPEGLALKFDDKDPRVAELRTFGHEQGWDQATFSRVLTFEASRVIAEAAAIRTAQEAEVKKLGAKGTERVTAAKTWLSGVLGSENRAAALMERMLFAEDIAALEDLQKAFSGQGGGAYTGNGRELPAPPAKPFTQILWPNRPLT